MQKLRKRWLLVLMSVLSACLFLFGAVACGDDEDGDNGDNGENTDPVKYTVTYVSGAEDASGEVQSASHAAGEKFNLPAADVYVREGYEFTNWGEGTSVYAAGSEYTMPARDVTFTPQWVEVEAQEPLPEGTETITAFPESAALMTSTDKPNTATAYWDVTYGESALNISVLVKDNAVVYKGTIFQNDGVKVYATKTQRVKGYTADTVCVLADASGKSKITNPVNDATVEDSGITVTNHLVTLDGKTAAGYRVEISIPEAAAGFTVAEKDAAVCLVLTNASYAGNARAIVEDAYGTAEGKTHTFIAVTDDNVFEANPYVQYGENWGDSGELKATENWNIDYDVTGLTDEDENEIDPYISLAVEGGQIGDNNVYWHKGYTGTVYFETQLKVEGRLTADYSDKAPKFGVSVTSTDGERGYFYYVGADSGDDGMPNANATSLGYVKRSGAGFGAWTGWTDNVGNMGGTSSQYVDRYIRMGIYRDGLTISLIFNGERVTSIPSVFGEDEEIVFGLVSFQYAIKATGYSAKEGKDDRFDITRESIDYLFLGDSYIDTAFWYQYNSAFGKLSAANIGVGGTQVPYWDNMLTYVSLRYDPQNIIVHIGVNDIDDAGLTAEEAIARLTGMFDGYQTAFPDAKLYYITIERNMTFKSAGKWAIYDEVNEWAREEHKTRDNFEIIDMAALVTDDESTMNWMMADNMHYGLEGYALFTRTIMNALNLDRYEATAGLGDMDTMGSGESYSADWRVESGIWHASGISKGANSDVGSQLPVLDSKGANVYASAQVSIKDALNGENAGKAGLAISSKNTTYFFFIDLQSGANANGWTNNWGSLAYRKNEMSKAWVWPESGYKPFGGNGYANLGSHAFDWNVNNEAYMTLAVAKVGTKLSFYASNSLINTVDSLFAADEEVSVSVYSFNIDFYAKGGTAFTGTAQEVEQHIDDTFNYLKPLKTLDGKLDDWTAAEKAHSFVLPAMDNAGVTVYATMDDRGVNVYYDAYHKVKKSDNAVDWWRNTNIEFRIGDGSIQSWMNLRQESNGITEGFFQTTDPETAGGLYHTVAEVFVAYEHIAGGTYTKDSAFVPASFAFKTEAEPSPFWTNGDWWFEIDHGPADSQPFKITTNGLAVHADPTSANITLDGEIADWSSVTFQNKDHVSYAGKLESDGLYLCFILKADTLDENRARSGGDVWLNHNIEILDSANFYHGRIAYYNGQCFYTNNISKAATKFVKGTGGAGDQVVFEVFIANSDAKNLNATMGSVTFNFGGQYFTDADDAGNKWGDVYTEGFTVNR